MSQIEDRSSKELVARWITFELGERCDEYSPHCLTCMTWKVFDETDLWPEPQRAADEPNADLRAALVHAVSVIQTWHNMGVPRREQSDMWDIYWRKSPEMQPIRAALSEDVSQ